MSSDFQSSHVPGIQTNAVNPAAAANAGNATHCRFYCFTITPTLIVGSSYCCNHCGSVMSCEECGSCRGCGAVDDNELQTLGQAILYDLNEFLRECGD